MTNILMKYMENRFQPKVASSPKEVLREGPVVTISRECGCPVVKIANLMKEKLITITGKEWRLVSKEILEKSAQELNMDPSKLEYVFNSEGKTTWDEIIGALSSKYYQSDRKIKKTIADVIRTFASKGHYIIIGRGSVAIANDIEQSFHIKLQAPLEWRIDQLKKVYNMDKEQLTRYAQDIDKKRESLINYFHKTPLSNTVFDVIYNAMTLTDEQIAESCVNLIQHKGVFGKSLFTG